MKPLEGLVKISSDDGTQRQGWNGRVRETLRLIGGHDAGTVMGIPTNLDRQQKE
jgi:hypothetical protein